VGTQPNTFNDTPGNTTHGTLHHAGGAAGSATSISQAAFSQSDSLAGINSNPQAARSIDPASSQSINTPTTLSAQQYHEEMAKAFLINLSQSAFQAAHPRTSTSLDMSIVAILLSRGLSDEQVALFLSRVDHASANSMMELLAANPFTAQSYSEPYLPNLFGVPASEEELNSDYAAFPGPAGLPPAPPGPGSATPPAPGIRGASHGAIPDPGPLPAAPPAPPAPPVVAGAQVPGGWEGLEILPGQEVHNWTRLEAAASAVMDRMNDTIGRLEPPPLLVQDIRQFGQDCLELGLDGIAAISDLVGAIRDPTPPNSLVQNWSAIIRETTSLLRQGAHSDPISTFRHVGVKTVRSQTEQFLFQQQQRAQQQQSLIDQMQAQLQQSAHQSSGGSAFTAPGGGPSAFTASGGAPPLPPSLGAADRPVDRRNALPTAAVPRQLASALAAVGGGAPRSSFPSGPSGPPGGAPGPVPAGTSHPPYPPSGFPGMPSGPPGGVPAPAPAGASHSPYPPSGFPGMPSGPPGGYPPSGFPGMPPAPPGGASGSVPAGTSFPAAPDGHSPPPLTPAHGPSSSSSFSIPLPPFLANGDPPTWFTDGVGSEGLDVNRGTKLAKGNQTVKEVWQSRVNGAPKLQSDMRTAPNNVEAFYQVMNHTKGDDQYIGVRSSLLHMAARQYLFFAAVKQNDEEAANLLLSQLIQAACMVSGLAAEHPQFRPLAELGHDGIRNFFNLLDFSFIDAGDVVVPEWHSPEWKAGETALGLFIRLKSLAASEGLAPSSSLDNMLVQKFKLAVKAACRASPDDELVSRVHDDFVAGYSAYPSYSTFVLGLQQKAIAKRPRSGPGRPSKRAAEALMGGQPAAPPPSSIDVGAVQQQLQALQLEMQSYKAAHTAELARARTDHASALQQAYAHAAKTSPHASELALVQRQGAEALARAQQEAAAFAALANAQQGAAPTSPIAAAATAPRKYDSNIPVFTDLSQLSADRPAWITLEMVNEAVAESQGGAAMFHGIPAEVFATGRVTGLLPCVPIRNPARPDGLVGWGSCAQCDAAKPAGIDPSALKNVAYNEFVATGRKMRQIEKHEKILHVSLKCYQRRSLIRQHVRKTHADAWMLVSISKATQDALLAGH